MEYEREWTSQKKLVCSTITGTKLAPSTCWVVLQNLAEIFECAFDLVTKFIHQWRHQITLDWLPSSLSCEKRWAPSGLIYCPSALLDTLRWGIFCGGQCAATGCKPKDQGSGSTWPASRPSPSGFYNWTSRHRWILCRSGWLTSGQRSAEMRHRLLWVYNVIMEWVYLSFHQSCYLTIVLNVHKESTVIFVFIV